MGSPLGNMFGGQGMGGAFGGDSGYQKLDDSSYEGMGNGFGTGGMDNNSGYQAMGTGSFGTTGGNSSYQEMESHTNNNVLSNNFSNRIRDHGMSNGYSNSSNYSNLNTNYSNPNDGNYTNLNYSSENSLPVGYDNIQSSNYGTRYS